MLLKWCNLFIYTLLRNSLLNCAKDGIDVKNMLYRPNVGGTKEGILVVQNWKHIYTYFYIGDF